MTVLLFVSFALQHIVSGFIIFFLMIFMFLLVPLEIWQYGHALEVNVDGKVKYRYCHSREIHLWQQSPGIGIASLPVCCCQSLFSRRLVKMSRQA